jgi:hypothetical protein
MRGSALNQFPLFRLLLLLLLLLTSVSRNV